MFFDHDASKKWHVGQQMTSNESETLEEVEQKQN